MVVSAQNEYIMPLARSRKRCSLTTKTAKGHLSHVYRKLEITRRGQLANALTDHFDDGGENLSATATHSKACFLWAAATAP